MLRLNNNMGKMIALRSPKGYLFLLGFLCSSFGFIVIRYFAQDASDDLVHEVRQSDLSILTKTKQLEDEAAQLRIRLLEMEVELTHLKTFSQPKPFPFVKQLNFHHKKRILITGGAGFVGSHLDLASPASPPHYMLNPVKTIKTNTLGTINMLGLARRVGARILVASTSEVYGDPEVHPQSEEYWGHVNPIGPRSCYDEGKRVAEALCYAYTKQERLEVRVARIFNTYGPRMHLNDGRVVSNFVLQAIQNKSITIYGSGKQTRSFQYVSDLVDGLVALMHSNYSAPVNLGNPDEYTIQDFATVIQQLVGGTKRTSQIVHMNSVQDDPQRRKPDISVAKRVLGWSPKVSLQKGLEKTVQYFRKKLLTEGDQEGDKKL